MPQDRVTKTLAATAGAASAMITIAAATVDRQSPIDAVVLLVLLVALLLLCVPYWIAIVVSSRTQAGRTWGRIAVALYGFVDVATRAQVTWWPGSSTDGIAMLTLPIVVAPLVALAAVVVAAAWVRVSSD